MFLRCLLALSLILIFPASAFAYSYGDPNKEPIAETYKEIAAKLEQKPEDWNGAYQAFLSRQSEISLEFGDKIAKVLDENLKQKQKDLFLGNYKSVLVMNINRRLDNAEQQFSDYAKAKLLLAKGRGTVTVLAPYLDEETSKTALTAFDNALNALGNPGLFGVGAVPANKTVFLAQTELIRKTLNPLFPFKESASDAAQPPATGNVGAGTPAEQAAGTKVNPAVTISVIGGLALVAGILIWIARRNKMI